MEKMSDILKEFEERTKNVINDTTREVWENDETLDNFYQFDIHLWRKKGMGNSLQTISGNKISIKVALSSLFHTLIYEESFTKKELLDMVELGSLSEEEILKGEY